jgi:hypothetical protein
MHSQAVGRMSKVEKMSKKGPRNHGCIFLHEILRPALQWGTHATTHNALKSFANDSTSIPYLLNWKHLWCTRVSSRLFSLMTCLRSRDTRPLSDTMRTSRAAWSDAERDRISWITPRTLILCAFRFILLFIRYATNLPCARDFFLTNMLGKQKKKTKW